MNTDPIPDELITHRLFKGTYVELNLKQNPENSYESYFELNQSLSMSMMPELFEALDIIIKHNFHLEIPTPAIATYTSNPMEGSIRASNTRDKVRSKVSELKTGAGIRIPMVSVLTGDWRKDLAIRGVCALSQVPVAANIEEAKEVAKKVVIKIAADINDKRQKADEEDAKL